MKDWPGRRNRLPHPVCKPWHGKEGGADGFVCRANFSLLLTLPVAALNPSVSATLGRTPEIKAFGWLLTLMLAPNGKQYAGEFPCGTHHAVSKKLRRSKAKLKSKSVHPVARGFIPTAPAAGQMLRRPS